MVEAVQEKHQQIPHHKPQVRMKGQESLVQVRLLVRDLHCEHEARVVIWQRKVDFLGQICRDADGASSEISSSILDRGNGTCDFLWLLLVDDVRKFYLDQFAHFCQQIDHSTRETSVALLAFVVHDKWRRGVQGNHHDLRAKGVANRLVIKNTARLWLLGLM